jgi:hypothetical protein
MGKRIKLIVGWILLAWAALLFLGRLNQPQAPASPTTTSRERYVDIAALLTPFIFSAVGLSLLLSARRIKKP